MTIILWLAKLQWCKLVDHLTYEKFWSVEKLSLFLMGFINITFLMMSLHHSMWLIPLVAFNVLFLFSAMPKHNILQSLLLSIGFKKQKDILEYFQIQIRVKEQSKKKVNSDEISTTSSQTNQIILNSYSIFSDNMPLMESETEINKSESLYYHWQN